MLLPKVIDPREYLPDLDNLNRASSMLLARYVFYDSLLDQSGHQFHLSLLSEEAKPQFEGFELNGGTTPSFKADVSSGSTAGLDGLLLGELSICTFVKINKIADGNTILIKFTSENDEEITLMFGIYQNPETGSRSWVLFLIGLEENFLFSVAALPKTEYYVCLVLESKSDKSYHGLLVVDGSTVFDNIIKGTNTTATGAHKSVLSKNLYIGQLVDGVIYEMSVFGRTLESEFISTLMRTSQTKLQLRGQNKADVDIITNPPTPAPPELVNGLLFYIPLRGGLGKTGSIIGVEPSFVTNGQSLPEGYLIQDHATDFLTYETLRIMKAVSFSIAFSVNTTTGTLLTVTDLHSIFLDSGKLKVTYNKQTSTISDVTIQTEKWTHILVTVTADGTQVIVYVDGVFKAQFPAGSATAQTQVVTISSEEEGILGTFCEFRGYNAPISSSEVKKIYSQLRNHPLMYCIKSVCAEVDTDSENIVQTMKTVTLSDSENIIITSPLVAVYKLTSAVEGDACRESFLINVENGTHTRVPFGRYTICGETVYGDSISMGIIVVISQVLSIGGYAPGEIPVLPEHQIMLPVIPDVRNLDSLEVLVCGSDSSVSLISSPVLLVTEITERVSICFGDGSKTGWDLVPAPIRLDDSDEAPFKTESRRFSDGIIRLPAIVYHNVTVEVHDLPKSVSNDPAQARVKVTPKAGDCDSNGASHMAGTLRKKDDSDDILMTFGVATFEAIQSGNLRVNRLCLSLSQTAPWQELNITLSILDPSINEIQLEDGLFTVEGQTAIHLIGSGMELFTENSGLNGRIGAEQLHGSWLVGGPLQAKGNEAISTLIFPRIIENTKDDNLPDIPIFGSGVDSNDTAGEDRPSKPQKENEKRNLGDRMMGSFRQEKPSFELTDSLDIELELFIFGNWVRYGIEEGVQIRHIRIDGLNVLKRGSDVLEPFSLNISNRTDSWIYSSPGNVEPVPLGFMALGLDMIASVIGSSLNYGPGIDITFAEHCSEITSNSTDASITFPTPPAGPGGPGNGIPRNKTFPEITFPGSFLSPPKIGIHSMCLRSGSGYPGTWYPAGFKIHVIPKITSLGYDGEIVFQDTFITTGNLEMIAGSEPEIEIGHLTPEDYEEDGILWLSFGINDCLIQPHRLSDSDPDAYAFPVQPITSNSSGEKTLVLSLNGAETVNLGNLVSETSPEPLYICVGYGTDQNMAPYQNNFFTKLKTRLIITGFRIGDLNAPLHPYSGKQDTSDFVENTKLPVYELYDASGFLEMKTELQHVMIIAINVDKKCGSLPLSSGQELLAGGKFNLAAPGYEFLTGDEYRLCAMIPSQKVNGIRITAPFTSFEDTGFRFVGISLSSFGDIQSNFADGYDTQIAVMQNEGVTLPFIFEPPGVIASSQLSDEVTSQVLIKFVDTTSCNDEGYEIPLGKTRSIIFPETLQTSGKVYKLCLKVRLRGLYPGTTIWIRPPFQVKILPFSTINGRSQKQAGRPLTFFHGLVGNFLFDCKQRQDGCLHKDVSNMVLEVTNGCFSKNKTIFSRADVLYSHERKYHFKTHRPMKTTMSTGPLEICINAAALTLKVEVLSISISGLNIGIDSTNTSTLTVRKSKGIEDERATTLSVATQGQTLSPIWVSISRLHRCGTNIGAIVDGVSTAPIPVQACSGFLTINKEAYAPRETNTKLSLCVAAANEGNDAPETMFFMNTILNYMVTDHESFQVEQQPGQVSFADGILTVNPTLRIVSADSHQPMTTLSQDVTIKLHYEYCNVDDYDYEQCMMFCHLTGQFNYSSANITCNEHCEDISQHSCYVNESISWMLEEDHTIPQKTVRPEEYSSNGAIIKFDKLVLRGKHRVWYRIVFQSVLEGEMRAATEPFRMGPCYHWNVGSWVLDSGINRTRFRFNSSVEKSQLEWKSGTSSYAIPGSTLCHVCPEGGICDGSTDIRTDGNYFRPSFLSTTFYNCLESQACEQNKSIGTCKDGYKTHDITEAEYHNPICMLCAEGYGKVPGSSTLCRECLPDEWTWTYAVVTGIIAFLAIMFLVRQSIVSGNQGDRGGSDFMIYFKLLTTHCATASLLGDYGNKMASMVQGFLDYEKTASGGTVGDLSTIDCVLPNNYYDKFTFFMLIPCFIPVVLSVVFFLLLLIRICTSDKPKYQELTKEASIALFSELYVLYENDNPAGKKPGDKPPDEKPNDKPGDKPQNEKPNDKPGDKPQNEKPNDKPGDKPPDEKPNDKPGDKPQNEKPNDKPDNKPQNEKPNDKPGDKPPDEKPNDKPGDKPQNEKPNDKLSDKKPNEKKNTKGKKTKVYLPIPAEFILKNKEHMMKFVNSKTNLELTVTSFANMSNCGTYDAHRLNDTLQIIVRAAAKHETIMNIHDADLIFGHLVCRALKAKIDGKIPEEDDEIIHLKHNSRVYAEHGNWNSIPMTKVEEFFPIFEMRHKQFSNVLGYLNFEQLREHYFTVDKTCNPERLNNTMVTDVWFKEMLMATITETNISAYDHFIKKMRHFKIITGEEHNTVLTSEHIRSGFDMYMLRNPHQDFSVRMPWFKFWEGLDRQNGEAKHISKADFMATVTDSRAGVYLRKKHQEYVDIQKKEDWLGHYLGFKTDKLHHPFLAAIVVASVIAYPHLVRTAALFMQCDGYDYGGVGLAHGSERQFFRHDLSLDCNSDRFKYYQNVAKGLLALYGAGIPLAAMYGMYLMTNAEKTEKRLRSEKFACLGDLSDNEDDAADIKEDAKLAKRKLMSLLGANDGTRRMRGNQDDIMHDEKRQETMMGARRQLTKKLKNAEDRIAVFRMAFGFLAAGYRDEFAGWECVIMIRKLIMVVISVFLDGHASTALATWTMLVFCLIHRNVKPYKKSNVNQLESTSLIVITMTLQLSLLYDDDVAAFSEDMSENPWRRAGFWIVSIFLFVINVGVILLIIINWFHSSPGFFRDTVAGKYGLLNKFYASCISIMPKFLEFTQGRVLLRKNLLTNERWVNTIDDRKTAGELQLYEKNRLTLIGLKEKKKKKKVLKEEKQKQLEELEKNYDKENIDLLETRMPLMHVQEQEFLGVYWSRFLTNSIVLNRFDFSREIKHTVVGTDFKPRTVPSTQSLPAPVREPKPWFCVGSRVKLDPKVPAKYLKLYGKFDVPPMLEFEYKKQTYEMKLVHGNHNLRPFWKSTGDECVLLFFCNPKWYLVSYSKNVDKPEFEDEFTIICHSFMEDRHRKVADDYVFKEPGMDLKESVAEAAQHKKIIENARYDADEEEEEDDADLRNEEEEDELAINRMTVNYLPHIAKWPDGMAVRINCRGVIVSTMSFVVQEIQRYTAEVHFFTNRIQWYPESYEEEPNILVSLPLKDLVPDVDRVASSSNSYHQSGSWKILSDTDEMVVQPEKKIESIRAFARLRKTCCDGFAWESLEKKDANAENNDNFKTFGDASALHSCEKCEVCFCKGDQRIRCVIRGSNWEITELCTFYFKGGPPTWFLGYEAICDLPTCKWVGDPKILFGMNEQFCCSTDFINRSCILREEDAKSKNNITIGFEYWVPSDVGYAPICIQSLSVTEGPIAEQRSSPGFQAIISFVDVFEEEEDIIELRSMWDLERPMIEVSEKDKGNEVLLIENAREQLAKMVAANEAAKAQSAKKSMVMDPGSMPQHLSPVSEVTSVEKFTEDAESK